jgi:hypothetical protein
MNVEIEPRFLLKMHKIVDESGTSFDGIVNSALQAYLNKIHDADLQPLGDRELAANALGNMLINARNKRIGITNK